MGLHFTPDVAADLTPRAHLFGQVSERRQAEDHIQLGLPNVGRPPQ
jgi:hypothetical protein